MDDWLGLGLIVLLSFAWHFACINDAFSMGLLDELISGHEVFAAASESDKFLILPSKDDSSEIEEEDSVSL